MNQKIEITVPDIGDYSDIPVIEVLVSVGETVNIDQTLVTLESDKTTIDVPCPQKGIVESLRVRTGDKVSKGTVLLVLREEKLSDAENSKACSESLGSVAEDSFIPKTDLSEEERKMHQLIQTDVSDHFSLVPIRLPDIGAADLLPVVEIFSKIGDQIRIDEPILSLESDKATIDVPSMYDGIVKDITVKVGERIKQGSIIAVFAIEKEDSKHELRNEVSANKSKQIEYQHEIVNDTIDIEVHASPSVRKFAREVGVDLSKIQGSGQHGRILHVDLRDYMSTPLTTSVKTKKITENIVETVESNFPTILPWPDIDFTKFGACRREPLSRIKNISGANLHRNWVSIPHVTTHDDVDITDLEEFRIDRNKFFASRGGDVKLTTLAFLMKAVVFALKKFPVLNSSLVGKELVFKEYFHIGFAADTENGLVVPVIRNVDQKGIVEIAKNIADLANRARNGHLKNEDMQGGCFSISSLGGIGGRYFTPIINAPEVAILGIGRGSYRPVYVGGDLKKKFMLPLSLSYDHRVIDGATAARFNSFLIELLADMRHCLL